MILGIQAALRASSATEPHCKTTATLPYHSEKDPVHEIPQYAPASQALGISVIQHLKDFRTVYLCISYLGVGFEENY